MGKVFILVAEDDADDRFLIQTAFEEKGYTDKIQFVENGVELLAYLDSVKPVTPEVEYPRFILLDLNMPKKDGREALKEIKQHDVYKRIPVVIFTTTNNDAEIRRCYDLGANTYIVKPANFESLLTVLTDIRNYWIHTARVTN